MANNWAGAVDRLLGAALREFEAESVTFTPAGGPPIVVRGIFNNVWREVDPGTDAIISTNQPNLGIRLSDFGTRPPRDGDTVTVNGIAYRVSDPQEDGEGGCKILLHKIG